MQEEIKPDDLLRRPPDERSRNGRTCSLFSKKTARIDKKKKKCFILPPLCLLCRFLICSAAPDNHEHCHGSHTLIYSVQSDISVCVFMWFITFLIRKRINMITVGLIIRTNGISIRQKRAPLQPSVAPLRSTPDGMRNL